MERVPCEFFLLRYVPDAVKDEFVNIGVLLREAARPDEAVVRFTRDWSRVRCIDPDADTAMLEAMEAEIALRLRTSATDPKPLMTVLEDTFSNSIRITEARATLAESVPAELEQLMQLYVESRKLPAARRRTGRAAIAAAMRSEFERAGVWDLMRKRIAASAYTRTGDPLKLDCGYRPNGIIRIFHAVSLEGDLEAAKVLAFSSASLREGVQRVENAGLELTAVIEPLRQVDETTEGEAAERYRFGVETMEREAIRVLTTNDLPRLAETARRELNG
jgi:hypothetical protein